MGIDEAIKVFRNMLSQAYMQRKSLSPLHPLKPLYTGEEFDRILGEIITSRLGYHAKGLLFNSKDFDNQKSV